MKQAKKLPKYIPKEIEPKWQAKWKETNLYQFDADSDREPYYTLVELPYPSGDLHLGHWFAFVPPDAHARYIRMSGRNTFFPNGFDAFGLPAENAAIKRDIHPQDWTLKNIETMKKQFGTMGTMIDWSHEAITCLPEYYKWNQWIFLKMYERSVAYRGKVLSNWCPVDQTVLANEHVENGKCWRCGSVVEQKEVEQWFLKITEYADELLWDNVDKKASNGVNWPKSVREGQNNWIGKKEGIEITYPIENSEETLTVFTTRPDTNFGATFIALAPEHPLVKKITTKEQKDAVDLYVASAGRKTELERMQEAREKSGVFTGAYAINQLNGYKMPIWVSDFVLINFGTGALVGVPGHDLRDFEFASKFDLEIIRVVNGKNGDESPITKKEQVQEKEGTMMNSEFLNGLDIHQATRKIMDYLEEKGWGRRVINYHIRDWSVSRQRYWGTPVPMIHCEKCGIVPVPEKDLPVMLPYEVDYTPKGKPPLASAEDWMNVDCPNCGGKAVRDAETLDTFFDSSWYYYRYLDPRYTKLPFDTDLSKKLMPLDIYFGGSEHTLGHTLYARFFTKFFKDIGLVGFDEFAKKRVQHGVILGPDGNRMSKSKGNVVNPDDVVSEYGADTVRVYLSFMMPYEDTVAPWNPKAIAGMYRFLRRVWDLYEKVENTKQTVDDRYQMHKTIKKVGDDLRDIKFNTAIASMMEWLNYLSSKDRVSVEEYQALLLLLAPFAPHMTEEIWHSMNSQQAKNQQFQSIHLQKWPEYDDQYLVAETVTVAVQVNGKLRGSVEVNSSEAQVKSEVEARAKAIENVSKYVAGKNLVKVIYIEGKILNFVVK